MSVIVGAPLNAGFLADKGRFNYGGSAPSTMADRKTRIAQIASAYGTDLRTAALQFAAAPASVSAVLPGASNPEQVKSNAASMRATIPPAFWEELRAEGLIAPTAAVPALL